MNYNTMTYKQLIAHIAVMEHALEMEHQLLGEARSQIEELNRARVSIIDMYDEAAGKHLQNLARIAEQQSLLAQCLAALVCMRGEYNNELLIEQVKAALGVKV